MPNTPAMVQKGASVYVPGTSATKEDGLMTKKLMEAVGTCEEAIESYLDPVTALSGSGPAYVIITNNNNNNKLTEFSRKLNFLKIRYT